MNQQKPNANEEFWHQIQLKKSDRHCSPAHQRKGIFPSVAQGASFHLKSEGEV